MLCPDLRLILCRKGPGWPQGTGERGTAIFLFLMQRELEDPLARAIVALDNELSNGALSDKEIGEIWKELNLAPLPAPVPADQISPAIIAGQSPPCSPQPCIFLSIN